MARTVVLRHDLPDGTHHYDWLIEPMGVSPPTTPRLSAPDPDQRVLIAWRLAIPPTDAIDTTLQAERLPPHRRLYLDYEGTIAGNRGSVRRVAEGTIEIVRDSAEGFEAEAVFGADCLRVSASPEQHNMWRMALTLG